jgi:hypothetical protein
MSPRHYVHNEVPVLGAELLLDILFLESIFTGFRIEVFADIVPLENVCQQVLTDL